MKIIFIHGVTEGLAWSYTKYKIPGTAIQLCIKSKAYDTLQSTDFLGLPTHMIGAVSAGGTHKGKKQSTSNWALKVKLCQNRFYSISPRSANREEPVFQVDKIRTLTGFPPLMGVFFMRSELGKPHNLLGTYPGISLLLDKDEQQNRPKW